MLILTYSKKINSKMLGFIFDSEASSHKNQSGIKLLLKDFNASKTKKAFIPFEPYFYFLPTNNDLDKSIELSKSISANVKGKIFKIKDALKIEKKIGFKQISVLKIICFGPSDVPILREEFKKFGVVYEFDIPFARRFSIDNHLFHLINYDWTIDSKIVTNYKSDSNESESQIASKLNSMAFDIETHNPSGLPVPQTDPCIMISYSTSKDAENARVITYNKENFGKPFVILVEDEKSMIEKFSAVLKSHKIDILCGYNSDEFDIPYLDERAKKTKANINLGRGKKSRILIKQLGLRRRAKISGRVHLDLFPPISLMDFIGAIKFPRLTLGVVYNTLTGQDKTDIKKDTIWKAWDDGGESLSHLYDYSQDDAIACRNVLDFVLPLQISLAKVTGMSLFDVSRSTTGQMVESILMQRAFDRNELLPNKPDFATTESRREDAIQGAYVKVPQPGIYEKIVVFDFRSLYPSIITSFNIDPFTLNCTCCSQEESYVAPTGARFCKKNKGIVPETLNYVLDERMKIKSQLKTVEKKSDLYITLDSRQWALKILANSTYGYLVYARSRYYSRDCGSAITAFARHYIQQTMKEAENAGFTVLYGDTDSLFVQLGNKTIEDAKEFQKAINKTLPGRMELEFEDYFPRGIFVSKKGEEQGARKKYALISQSGFIKIRGFELVRRDWSTIARETQRNVLDILLREGDLKKAVALVKKTIDDLYTFKVPIANCAIRTQLKKDVSKYEVKSPEVGAVLNARKQGINVTNYSLVEYVITKKGKTISEKAQILDLATDYDPEYYVNKQILPAVLKILGELGVNEQDIKTSSSQKTLGNW